MVAMLSDAVRYRRAARDRRYPVARDSSRRPHPNRRRNTTGRRNTRGRPDPPRGQNHRGRRPGHTRWRTRSCCNPPRPAKRRSRRRLASEPRRARISSSAVVISRFLPSLDSRSVSPLDGTAEKIGQFRHRFALQICTEASLCFINCSVLNRGAVVHRGVNVRFIRSRQGGRYGCE